MYDSIDLLGAATMTGPIQLLLPFDPAKGSMQLSGKLYFHLEKYARKEGIPPEAFKQVIGTLMKKVENVTMNSKAQKALEIDPIHQ